MAAWAVVALAAPGAQGGWQLGQQETVLQKGVATQPCIHAWRIPLTEKSGRPQSILTELDTTGVIPHA